jgi:hypothetical protein
VKRSSCLFSRDDADLLFLEISPCLRLLLTANCIPSTGSVGLWRLLYHDSKLPNQPKEVIAAEYLMRISTMTHAMQAHFFYALPTQETASGLVSPVTSSRSLSRAAPPKLGLKLALTTSTRALQLFDLSDIDVGLLQSQPHTRSHGDGSGAASIITNMYGTATSKQKEGMEPDLTSSTAATSERAPDAAGHLQVNPNASQSASVSSPASSSLHASSQISPSLASPTLSAPPVHPLSHVSPPVRDQALPSSSADLLSPSSPVHVIHSLEVELATTRGGKLYPKMDVRFHSDRLLQAQTQMFKLHMHSALHA